MKTMIPHKTGDDQPRFFDWIAKTSKPIRNALACRELLPSGARHFPRAFALASVLALAALAVPNRSLAQTPTFSTLLSTPTSGPSYVYPLFAAVGDFDGDGKLDALVTDGSANVHELLGNGDGTFVEHFFPMPQIGGGYSGVVGLPPILNSYLPHPIDGVGLIRAADVNGDGKLDLLMVVGSHIANATSPNGFVAVAINNGNDTYGVPQFDVTYYYITSFSDIRSLTVGDLNGDGYPDFIVGGGTSELQIYLNNGDGTFTAGQSTSIKPNGGGPAVGPGVIADVNGDGNPDYVVTSNQASAIDVFFGNGDGTLQPPVILSYSGVTSIAVADVNGDGKLDLLVVQLGSPNSLMVFLNAGGGSFNPPTLYSTAGTAWNSWTSMSTADLNGDGKLDVVIANSEDNNVAVLLGDGSGTFGAPALFTVNRTPLDMSVGDFNGDGEPDIGTVCNLDKTFSVLLNTTVFPTPAQLFFTDSLTGPSSPNLASIPAGKYSYSSSGLQRTQSDSVTDRPMVDTALSSYLTENNFVAELTVKVADGDILFFGVGQGDTDAGYDNEPSHAFYFRVHNLPGYSGIQADVRSSSTGADAGYQAVNEIGTYAPGSTITLRIVRNGDNITMSVVGGGSVNYSLSAYNGSLGLTDGNTRVFFGNGSAGSVFSNLRIYPMPPPMITSATTASGGYGSAFSYTITATESPTSYSATGLPDSLSLDPSTGIISGNLPGTPGTYPITISASNAGGTGSATLTLNVIDNVKPVLTLPADITAEATSPAGAVVNFTVSANDAIDGPVPVALSASSGTTFPLGVSHVTASAQDTAGNVATGGFTITVQDTTPPVIKSLTASSSTLWPPNHKMVPVTITANASDAVGVTSLSILSVTSNEADNGQGDGNTQNDIVFSQAPLTVNGTEVSGDLGLSLRAERSGKGNGRIYTITIQASDAAGNTSQGTVTVTVPKSQGK